MNFSIRCIFNSEKHTTIKGGENRCYKSNHHSEMLYFTSKTPFKFVLLSVVEHTFKFKSVNSHSHLNNKSLRLAFWSLGRMRIQGFTPHNLFRKSEEKPGTRMCKKPPNNVTLNVASPSPTDEATAPNQWFSAGCNSVPQETPCSVWRELGCPSGEGGCFRHLVGRRLLTLQCTAPYYKGLSSPMSTVVRLRKPFPNNHSD